MTISFILTDSQGIMLQRQIVETSYNLKQAFLKAKNSKDYNTMFSLVATIYGWNGIVGKLTPELKDLDLQMIGQQHHDQMMSGNVAPISGIGEGLKGTNDDYDLSEMYKWRGERG